MLCIHEIILITCFLTNSAMYFLIGLAICSSSKTAPPFMPWRAAASWVAMWKNSCMDCRRFRKNKGESRLWASLFQGDNCAMKRTRVKSSQVKSSQVKFIYSTRRIRSSLRLINMGIQIDIIQGDR